MASSQTSSHSQKRDQIIDGRLFSRSTVMDRIRNEVEDDDSMEIIISKLEEQGLYRLGHSHTEMYDEQIVEIFYHDASVKVFSRKHGGGVSNISATVQGISICIDNDLLKSMFSLPSDGLTMEELESFSYDELSVFIQDAVEALYQVGKEMDWLNLTASKEMASVKVEMTRIAEAFRTLPQDLKEAFVKFQHLEEQSLLEEESKLRVVESQMVDVLQYMDSRISDHDAKIHEMAKVISSLDEKLAKFEEQ
ncbi:hypothetical protein OROHE_017896 [Orobanche hederae]